MTIGAGRLRSSARTTFMAITVLVPVLGARIAPLQAQTAITETRPAFISATVKASSSAARGGIALKQEGQFTATNVTLRQLMVAAYQRHTGDRREISGGPEWTESDRFDVDATAAGEHELDADGFPRRTWLMLQTLLAERFQLEVRSNSSERQVYSLEIVEPGKLGPNLASSNVDCAAVMRMLFRGTYPSKPLCGFGPYPRRLTASAVTMQQLAGYLSGLVKMTVIDRSGLAGQFDLELEAVEIAPPGPLGPSARSSGTTMSILQTMPKQLGLKLIPATAVVETIVIDRAEKPRDE